MYRTLRLADGKTAGRQRLQWTAHRNRVFGSKKASDEKSANKNAAKKAEAQTAAAKGKLHQAEAEWKTAMEELRQAQSEAHAARQAQEDAETILEFFKKNLLSAGRQGDASLTAAFWTENLGKDVSLAKPSTLPRGRSPRLSPTGPRPKHRYASFLPWLI